MVVYMNGFDILRCKRFYSVKRLGTLLKIDSNYHWNQSHIRTE